MLLVGGCSTAASSAGATPTHSPTTTPAFGTGIVTFGKSYNTNTLGIVGAETVFKTTTPLIAWSASFREAAGTTSVTSILASRTGSGVEITINEQQAQISDPRDDLIANKADLAWIAGRKPGTYVLRYLRGATVLAEGTFRLVR